MTKKPSEEEEFEVATISYSKDQYRMIIPKRIGIRMSFLNHQKVAVKIEIDRASEQFMAVKPIKSPYKTTKND